MNLRVADPLWVFKGSEVLVFSSAFLRFHRNEFNLDPCVEGIGDSGECTECDPPSPRLWRVARPLILNLRVPRPSFCEGRFIC